MCQLHGISHIQARRSYWDALPEKRFKRILANKVWAKRVKVSVEICGLRPSGILMEVSSDTSAAIEGSTELGC